MQIGRKTPIGSAMAVIALAGAVQASVIPSMDLPELYQDASIIVHGRVIDQSSQWEDVNGNHVIFTYSTVRVESSAKAAAPSRLMIIRSAGGEVDGFHQTLIGEATMAPGEEVVLFVTQEPGWSTPSVLGLRNGKFSVQHDAAGQVSLVRDQGQRPGAEPMPRDRFEVNQFLDTLDAVEAGELDAQDQIQPMSNIHTLTRARRPGERLIDARPVGAPVLATSTVSLTFDAPTCPDVNADGIVDVMDLSTMVSAWGSQSPAADLDENGTVDINDLTSLASGWGSCR